MNNKKLYSYVGPQEVRRRIGPDTARFRIRLPSDILAWVNDTDQQLTADCTVTATFVIDDAGDLWIADRHTEHVACARSEVVLSAGEMTFWIDGECVSVVNVTNQSTGYVPEPESWSAVSGALDGIGVEYSEFFEPAYEFRRCDACGAINIVKDGWLMCSICGAELDSDWNFD